MTVRSRHPESFVLFIEDRYVSDPFDPRITGPPGYDDAERKPVFRRKWHTIHLVGEHGAWIECFCERNRSLEVRHRAEWNIRALEEDLACACCNPGTLEYVRKPHAAPASIPNCAIGPLQPGNRWFIEATAIAGTFEDADELGPRQAPQVLHGKGERPSHRAADLQPPFLDIDL